MPISNTVSGLKHEFSFDELCTYYGGAFGSVALDSDDKLEGAASNKIHVDEYGYFGMPGRLWLGHTLLYNVPMQDGDRVRVAHKSTDTEHSSWALSVWGALPDW